MRFCLTYRNGFPAVTDPITRKIKLRKNVAYRDRGFLAHKYNPKKTPSDDSDPHTEP